jgi:hypothetical protein
VRETLDVWPPLPIVVQNLGLVLPSVDNLVAALEYNDRISEISLHHLSSSQFERVLAAMQQPFPALTGLQLWFNAGTALVDPVSFLGGSAPHLRSLSLRRNPLPGLPKLLLSATDLVTLRLSISHSGYISPEALATCLSVLIRLETLMIGFESPQSHPDRPLPPPPTRIHLPILRLLHFNGVSEYLEGLVTRIDAPLLGNMRIVFFHQLIFNTPHLTQFISRAPKFKTHDTVHVTFSLWAVLVRTFGKRLWFEISCRRSDWQFSSLAQVCGSAFPRAFIRAVEHLHVHTDFDDIPTPAAELPLLQALYGQDDVESNQWLEVFYPFTAVKYLYIPSEFTPRIAPVLQGLVGERVADVLPALQTLFLEEPLPSGHVEEAIGQFVAARRLAGYPISVSHYKN